MFLKFILIFLLFNSIRCQSDFEDEANPKLCNFFDSINITDGIRNSDQSITFDNIRFAKKNYGIFTYTYLANQVKISVPPYIRGCVCNYKNCVRLCCPVRHSLNQIEIDDKSQYKCVPNNNVTEIDLNHYTNITFVGGIPCMSAYKWVPPNKYFDNWRVLPNGSLILERYLDAYVVNRDGYCLAHVSDNDRFSTNVMLCASAPDEKPTPSIEQIFSSAVMIVTVIFLSLTLCIYFWIAELRTVHGKIFMCYLVTWIIGYSVLAFSRISNWHAYKRPIACLIIAELKHTSFIGGFIWLSIIGYDIWRAVGRADQRSNQFLEYCLFACGTTFLIVLITNILDYGDLLDQRLRPGLGTSGCWLQKKGYAYILYLYSIVIIIVIINTVIFILTKRKLDRAQQFASCATKLEGSRKFALDETDADRIQLFVRLAVAMGLPWLIQILVWPLGIWSYFGFIIFQIVNIAIKLVGPVVFFLCINKPRVKRLIGKKWSTLRSNGVGSSATQQTNISAH